MIRVHHLDSSRSHRVLWLLEELGLTYEVVQYRRDPRTQLAPRALRAIHPLGKSPVVEDGGRILAESGAILETLLERHGGGRLVPPRGSDAWVRHVYFLHYAEGSLMSPLFTQLVLQRLGPLGWPARGYVRGQLRRHLDFLEGELQGRDFLAGDELTAADIQMSYPMEAAAVRAGLDAGRPRLLAYLERLRARPAYRRALDRGGELRIPR